MSRGAPLAGVPGCVLLDPVGTLSDRHRDFSRQRGTRAGRGGRMKTVAMAASVHDAMRGTTTPAPMRRPGRACYVRR